MSKLVQSLMKGRFEQTRSMLMTVKGEICLPGNI